MKILLAGMNYMPNQFSRAIEQAGCQVVHTSGDPGAFPKWCEAVIVAKCQISHQKFYDVKDAYTEQGKPVFTGENFSTIKERFLDFVEKRRAELRPNTGFAQAFAAAKYTPPMPGDVSESDKDDIVRDEANKYLTTEEKEDMARRIIKVKSGVPQMQFRYSPESKAEIQKIIAESKDAKLSAEDTAKMLTAHNLTKADGSKFNAGDVYNLRSVYKKQAEKEEAEAQVKKKYLERADVIAVAPVAVVASGDSSNSVTLFKRILGLNLSADKTVQFQAWLLDGKINIEQALWFLDIIESRKK